MIPQENFCVTCEKSAVIDQTASDVADLKVDMATIKGAITGSDLHPNGINEKLRKNHVRIARVERMLWTAAGAAGVIVFVIKVLL